jgi:NAD(P)-dependent dehydrogenase (short-subunit alcohol dehydrogenase family)
MSSFDGKTVLVTGGGTGIGKGCAEHFRMSGATVTIAGPDGEILESAAAELLQRTGNDGIRTAVCDVTDDDLERKAVAVAANTSGLDVLIANAGTGWPGPVQLLDKAQWHIAYDVNVVGSALRIRHASAAMRPAGAAPWWPSRAWRRCAQAVHAGLQRHQGRAGLARRMCGKGTRAAWDPGQRCSAGCRAHRFRASPAQRCIDLDCFAEVCS